MGKINCFYCNRKCKGDVLKVGEKYFHKECFTCQVCHKKMENTGFFCKDNLFYCLEDYKKYCASLCFSCNEKIIGEVVTALNHTFHKNCFKCSLCQKSFSPGDKVSMRGSEFLCYECCGNLSNGKELLDVTIPNQKITEEKQSLVNSYNHLDESKSKHEDLQNLTIPIRRMNNLSNHERPLSNSAVHQINCPTNGRHRATSTGDHNLDNSTRSSLIVTPKHFHLPPGNGRDWLYNSPIVGTKSHPLALSANNINRSLSNSSQKIDNEDISKKETIKKTVSYPYGDDRDGIHDVPTGRDNGSVTVPTMVATSERNRRRMQNPTVEALSAGTTPKVRKARSQNKTIDRNGSSSHSPSLNRLRLSEVIKKSSDCSSLPRTKKVEEKHVGDIPRDPVSASRSPSAVREPLVPPRYDDHTETSPSRNDEYFRSSERHLGYSMEFINSTQRSFTSDHPSPGDLRSLMVDKHLENSSDDRGLKKMRVQGHIVDGNQAQRGRRHNPDQLARDTLSFNKRMTIPYEQLKVSSLKMIRNVDKSNLEAYLNDDEFMKLFHLTKPGFYQLPEWKRNDLKKRVDLF